MTRTLLSLLLVTPLLACSAADPQDPAESFAAPAPGLRVCSPGDSDPTTCRSCVGGVLKSWCATGETCFDGVCKVETRAAGSACTAANQCATAFCTDGVCCNVASCGGGCEFCGAGGACGVRTDRAPKTCSLAVGTAPCGTPGCNGAASCTYPAAAKTCTGLCVGDASTGFSYGGTGACDGAASCKVTSGALSCGAYRCDAATGCKSSCLTDADCLTTAFCDGGACKPKVSTGSVCVDDRACAAGAGSCKASPDGKRCCTASCTAPQACDTKGTACVGTLPVGDACTTGAVCATGKCHPTGKCAACTGDADCPSVEYCDATSLKCVPRAGVGSTCTTSASCPTGLSCTEGVCCEKADCGAGKTCAGAHKGRCTKTSGTACGADGECDSDHCVDGVCCDSGCNGQCEACDVAGSVGKCVAVKGGPHAARPACPGAEVDVCARASCDGAARDACKGFTSSSVECRKATCTDGKAVSPATCTGAGACPAVVVTACGGYACDAAGLACRTQCTAASDCVEGFVCHDARCEPKTATCSPDNRKSVLRDGGEKACEPFACDPATGNCFDRCTSSQQCLPGFACDGDKCAPVAAPGMAADGGCQLGAGPSGSFAALAMVAGLLGRLRRRARRR